MCLRQSSTAQRLDGTKRAASHDWDTLVVPKNYVNSYGIFVDSNYNDGAIRKIVRSSVPVSFHARDANIHASFVSGCKRFVGFAAWTTIAISVVVLIGCGMNSRALKSVFTGLPMAPVTAACLLSLGAALRAAAHARSTDRTRINAPFVFAAAAMALELLNLTVSGFQNGPLANETVGSPAMKVAVFILAAALMFQLSDSSRFAEVGQCLSAVALFIGEVALLGYVFGLEASHRLPGFQLVALPSAVLVVLLAFGLLCLHPRAGLVAPIAANRPGGAVARHLLLFVLFCPVVANLLLAICVRLGWFQRGLDGLIDIGAGGILAFFIWSSAVTMNRLDERRQEAESHNSLLAAVVDTTQDAIISKDLDARILSWNRAAERVYGYTEAEAIGQPIGLIVPDNRSGQVDEFMSRIRQGETIAQFETQRRRKDGAVIDVCLTISPVRSRDGQIIAASTIARDITELKKREDEVRFLASIVSNSPVFIGSIAPDNSLKFLNEAGKKLVGLKPESMPTDFFELIVEPDHNVVRGKALVATSQSGEWRGEVGMRNLQTGARIPTDCIVFAVQDKHGRLKQRAFVAVDATGRKQLEFERTNRIAQLTALRNIDIAISGTIDIRISLDIVAKEAAGTSGVRSACIYRWDGLSQCLREAPGACEPRFAKEHRALAEAAARSGRSQRTGHRTSIGEAVQFIESFPLIAKGVVNGVLTVLYAEGATQDTAPSAFMEALAGEAAIAIDNAQLFEDLQRSRSEIIAAYDQTLEGWARALDLRDKETEGHSRRVTDLTLEVARRMGLDATQLQVIRRGALLHDIGKMGVPDSILLKPGPLSEEEWHAMKKHAEYAFELLSPIEFLRSALDIPYCHHEKWDGTGYPRGLKGEQIPLAARIFAVVDVWDALNSDRPYRSAWTREAVISHIREESGRYFDPRIVKHFIETIEAID